MEVSIVNFRGIPRCTVVFSEIPGNVTLVKGKSGIGKTTLFSAVVWCLYGKRGFAKGSSVTITMSDWKCQRTSSPSDLKFTTEEEIQAKFGSQDTFLASTIIRQKSKNHFFSTNKIQLNILNELVFQDDNPRDIYHRLILNFKNLELSIRDKTTSINSFMELLSDYNPDLIVDIDLEERERLQRERDYALTYNKNTSEIMVKRSQSELENQVRANRELSTLSEELREIVLAQDFERRCSDYLGCDDIEEHILTLERNYRIWVDAMRLTRTSTLEECEIVVNEMRWRELESKYYHGERLDEGDGREARDETCPKCSHSWTSGVPGIERVKELNRQLDAFERESRDLPERGGDLSRDLPLHLPIRDLPLHLPQTRFPPKISSSEFRIMSRWRSWSIDETAEEELLQVASKKFRQKITDFPEDQNIGYWRNVKMKSEEMKKLRVLKERVEVQSAELSELREYKLKVQEAISIFQRTETEIMESQLGSINKIVNRCLAGFFKHSCTMTIFADGSISGYLKGRAFKCIDDLSGGEMDRICLAVTIGFSSQTSFPMIFCDESINSLDQETRISVIETIRRESSKAVVLIGHDEIEGICDDVIRVTDSFVGK